MQRQISAMANFNNYNIYGTNVGMTKEIGYRCAWDQQWIFKLYVHSQSKKNINSDTLQLLYKPWSISQAS